MTGTPIPNSLRRPQHPARAVPCPHCRADAGQPCTTRSGRRLLTDTPVHPARIDAHAATKPHTHPA